jgi:flagellar hook-basal body complex protein FliE
MRSHTPSVLAVLALALLAAACGTPPDREMNQARGAIDAARAAGAAEYAREEYDAAVAALKRSEDAVAQRDYRQALNSALDSRERAQAAARQAADGRAAARSQAEREVGDLQRALEAASQRLKAADALRPRRRGLARPARDLAALRTTLQKAREALAREDYAGARRTAAATVQQAGQVTREIEKLVAPPAPRRRR